MTLLHPDEARARLLAGIEPLPPAAIPIGNAAGRIAADTITARLTQPPFPASAMDGWAIRHIDLPGPFTIIGQSAAGHPFTGALGPGQTVRIFTGAPVPPGADTVIVQEEVTANATTATLTAEGPPHQGAHIRKAGQDFTAGQTLIPSSKILTARHLGLLAAAGHGSVPVYPRPRVTLIATGDELVPPGVIPGPGQIVSANGVMLAALLTAAGAAVSDLGILPDNREIIASAIKTAEADLIVTIGGASVGDHDLIIPALNELGATLDFWKVALRPGKPLIAGMLGPTRILGLPGNPVSAYVCAFLFAVPLVKALAGLPTDTPSFGAPLASPLPPTTNRRDYLRGQRLENGQVRPSPTQDSAQLARLAEADILIIREAHAPPAQSGDMVQCLALDTFSNVA